MKAIYFDRDGVVNLRRINDYVKIWEEFQFLPDIFDVLPAVHRAGYRAVLVTNQRGIARGLMSAAALDNIHMQMQSELQRRCDHSFDAIYHCPHDRDAGCDCRKPLPGMLVQAAADHGISLADSWIIGDSESDIRAGLAAGCRAARVITDPTEQTIAEITGSSLRDVWGRIVEIVGNGRKY